ncbi:unnamed protein product [Pneumocystis jirovecii]|uniref:Uncharacterized protein n=1 Tax=Pneumocystis jirovecii TaxID=42068 RepID=L0PAE2_PNEJI|nr:unnamed protein product [Pneumocystis jirovecii]
MSKRTKKELLENMEPDMDHHCEKILKKMEIQQHTKYLCTFCGKTSVISGGAWTISTTTAASVRSTIRRLREMAEA